MADPILNRSGTHRPTAASVPNGAGVIFQLQPNDDGTWHNVTLHRFCSLPNCADGARPWGDLIVDATGVLYGTTLFGGRKCAALSDGCGVVFKLVPSGEASQETVLYEFCKKSDCSDGAAPKSGLLETDTGDLVGTTSLGGGNDTAEFPKGAGTLFRLSGSAIQVLHRFCSAANCNDGAAPNAKPILGMAGEIYGTTNSGGQFGEPGGDGTVFRVRE